MNSMKCAKALIEAKAQVDALDNCGSSPLHYAVMMENLEIIVLLLDNGANALITDADNNTAMELAAEGKSTASKAILVIFQRHYERLKIPFPRTIRLKMAQFNPINPNSASNDNSNNVESATVKQQATVTKAAPSPKPVSAEPVMSKSKSKPHITEAHSSVPSPVTRPSSPPPKTIYDQLASGEMKSNDHPPRPQKAHAAQPGTTMVTSQSQTGFSRPPSAATVRSEPASNASSRPMSATRSPGSSSPMRGTLTDSKSQTPVFSVRHVERPLTPDAMRAIPSQTEVVTVRHAHEQDVQGSIIRPSSANKSPNKPRGKHTDQTQTLKTSEVISEDQEFQNQIAAISKAFEQQQTVTGTGSSKIINPAGTTGAKPVEVIPVVRENIAELVFPPADMIPFLPEVSSRLGDYNPAHLDVMIEVEHCCDCHLHNDQSLRHDPKKYVQVANAILYSLIKVVASSKLAVRLYALRSKTMSEKRVGALEVTVAIRLSFPEIEPMETSNIAATPSGRQKRPSFLVASPTAAKTAANREKDKKEKAPIREKENMRPQKWASHKIFSKLHSKR